MSSYKVLYKVHNDKYAEAQVEGSLSYQRKLEYKVSFKGFLSMNEIQMFVDQLKLYFLHNIDSRDSLSREYIRCNEIIYKINHYSRKEIKDVLEIELDLSKIHCESLY